MDQTTRYGAQYGEYESKGYSPHVERKGHGSVVDQRDERGSSAFRSAHGSPAYRPSSMGQYGVQEEEITELMPRGMIHTRGASSRGRYRKDRGMIHKLMSGKVLEDKGWLAAAMILGLLASYPLVIKPLHQVSKDMLSKMRGNLKTGAI